MENERTAAQVSEGKVRDGSGMSPYPIPADGGLRNSGLTNAGLTFQSGMRRQELKPAFDCIPSHALTRLARRYTLGLEHYGRDNWKKGLKDPTAIRDAFNHLVAHALQGLDRFEGRPVKEPNDDHWAAVAWAAFFMMEMEREHDAVPGEPHGQNDHA